jgi:hypothetical protein
VDTEIQFWLMTFLNDESNESREWDLVLPGGDEIGKADVYLRRNRARGVIGGGIGVENWHSFHCSTMYAKLAFSSDHDQTELILNLLVNT